MTRSAALPWVALLVFGAGWGLMQPFNKIAVEGGFQPFGIMVWQGVVSLCLAGALAFRKGPPRGRAQWTFCAQVALLGTLIPHFATYTAVGHLPAGLMAIIMALIPIMALIFGAFVGREPVTPVRIAGVTLGLIAIAIIAATRGQIGAGPLTGTGALMEAWPLWAVGVAVVAPVCYATNSTLTSMRGMAGLHPLQAFAGAAALFLPVAFIAAALTGQLHGLGADEASMAVLGAAIGHTLIYAGFLALIAHSGAVFASQTAYLVTGFGVLWSMVILAERYSPWVWAALCLMLLGVALVRPTRNADAKSPLAPPRA